MNPYHPHLERFPASLPGHILQGFHGALFFVALHVSKHSGALVPCNNQHEAKTVIHVSQ
jgi:hypothetical protein